ncbi:UNVERIFIED_CONTAM: hypothetical protein GTU68_066475 [Idotea baltica]|nr:hypothetical protein [Idotea baltica]
MTTTKNISYTFLD